MKINFRSLRLKQDANRTRLLHLLHMGLMLLFFIMRYLTGEVGLIRSVIALVAALIFYRFFFKTIKNLYYTFWTFSGFLALYITAQFFIVDSVVLTYCLMLAFIFLLSEMYVLSSPIYYPIVNWWDYDFRFRDDIKIKTSINDGEFTVGRLTDLRRQAACIVLFEDLDVGQRLSLEIDYADDHFTPTVEIMSKRQYSLGRPFHYGVSFIFKESFTKKDYQRLYLLWKHRRTQKKTHNILETDHDRV